MIYKDDERMRDFLGLFVFIVAKFYVWEAFLIKQYIPLALVGYEMIIVNSVQRASLAIYHLISNARSWNNC